MGDNVNKISLLIDGKEHGHAFRVGRTDRWCVHMSRKGIYRVLESIEEAAATLVSTRSDVVDDSEFSSILHACRPLDHVYFDRLLAASEDDLDGVYDNRIAKDRAVATGAMERFVAFRIRGDVTDLSAFHASF